MTIDVNRKCAQRIFRLSKVLIYHCWTANFWKGLVQAEALVNCIRRVLAKEAFSKVMKKVFSQKNNHKCDCRSGSGEFVNATTNNALKKLRRRKENKKLFRKVFKFNWLIAKLSRKKRWIMMLDVKSQNDEWSFENKFVSHKICRDLSLPATWTLVSCLSLPSLNR